MNYFKNKYIEMATDPDQTEFEKLRPEDTGCSRTIYVSKDNNLKVIIIVKEIGSEFIDNDSIVVHFNEKAPFADVNYWFNKNKKYLRKLSKDGNIISFYNNMIVYKKPTLITRIMDYFETF